MSEEKTTDQFNRALALLEATDNWLSREYNPARGTDEETAKALGKAAEDFGRDMFKGAENLSDAGLGGKSMFVCVEARAKLTLRAAARLLRSGAPPVDILVSTALSTVDFASDDLNGIPDAIADEIRRESAKGKVDALRSLFDEL